MAEQRKISSYKVKRFVGVSTVLIAFSAILIAATRKQSDQKIEDVIVTLKNQDRDQNFLLTKDVEQLFLTNNQIDVRSQTLKSLDLDNIEQIALSNPWVANAEVFVDNKNKLNIEVTQRVPIARIFDASGNSFYIDSSGFEMPLSKRYAYAVPVFTDFKRSKNDSITNNIKRNIVGLSEAIANDSFWNAQITQVDIVGLNNFDMFTTLGNQKIKFGDTTMLTEKLSNLMSFYKEVSNKIGWDRYNVIDLRFQGQVIASPSLGWTPPKDTAAAIIPKAGPIVHPEPIVTTIVKPTVAVAKVSAPITKPAAVATSIKKPEPQAPKKNTNTVAKPTVKADKATVAKTSNKAATSAKPVAPANKKTIKK